jgi:hypothetical protein
MCDSPESLQLAIIEQKELVNLPRRPFGAGL